MKLEVSIDPTVWYRLLPKFVKTIIEKLNITPESIRDTCFRMAVINSFDTDNKQRITIKKFVTQDSQEWNQVLELMGVSAMSWDAYIAPLPRVQQERIILDALAYLVLMAADGNKPLSEAIDMAYNKADIKELKFTVVTNKKSTLGKEVKGISDADEDIDEAYLRHIFEFWICLVNFLNGEFDEADMEASQVYELLQFYLKCTKKGVRLSRAIVTSKACTEIIGFFTGSQVGAKAITSLKEVEYSLTETIIDKLIGDDSTTVALELEDIAESRQGQEKYKVPVDDKTFRGKKISTRLKNALDGVFEFVRVEENQEKLVEGVKALIALTSVSRNNPEIRREISMVEKGAD